MTQKGFSLIELLLVMFLTAVLGLIVVKPSTSAINTVGLDAATRRVLSDIKYAQHLAVLTGVAHGVNWDATTGKYWIYRGSGAFNTVILDPLTQQTFSESLQEYGAVVVNKSGWLEFSPISAAPTYDGQGCVIGGCYAFLKQGSSYKGFTFNLQTGLVETVNF